MKLVTLAVLAALSANAYAGADKDCDTKPTAVPGSTVTGTQSQTQGQGQSQTGTVTGRQSQNAVTGPSTSNAQGGAGGLGGAGGSAAGGAGGSGGSAISGSASNNANDNASAGGSGGNTGPVTNSYTNVNPRAPVNSAFATPGMTTAGCRFSDAVGISAFIVSGSFSKSRADTDCRLATMADSQYARGNTMAGDKLTCRISYVHAALGDDCEALLNQAPAGKTYTESEVQTLLNKQAAVMHSSK